MRRAALIMSAAGAALAAGALMAGPAMAGTAAAKAPPQAAAAKTAVAPAGGPAPAGLWGDAEQLTSSQIPGFGTANPEADVVSCPSPGNCTAAGTYTDSSGIEQVFVASEASGNWGQATLVPGLNSLAAGGWAFVTSISCPAGGECALGGDYEDGQRHSHAFLAESRNGTWGNPRELAYPAGSTVQTSSSLFAVQSVSCSSPGNCAAVLSVPGPPRSGASSVSWEAYVASESNGTWSPAIGLSAVHSANQGGDALPTSVSCWSDGNCLAGGSFFDASGFQETFIATEAGGTWDGGRNLPGITGVTNYNPSGDSEVDSVSCVPAGNCAVAGVYFDTSRHYQPFVANEDAGNWTTQTVPGSVALHTGAGFITFPKVSCAAPRDCAYIAGYTDAAGNRPTLAATQGPAGWGSAAPISGVVNSGFAAAWTLSCTGAGACLTGGSFQTDASGHTQAFIAEEAGHAWRAAQPVPVNLAHGRSRAEAVSCATPGNCAAVGDYADADGNQQAFVIDESTAATVTTLSLPAPVATWGSEQAEHLAVTVTSTSGTPTGQVTIQAGPTTICTITLASGTGTCTLTANQLFPGSYQLTATYTGDSAFSPSTSAPRPLTVTGPATSVTSLALSAAQAAFGNEQAEHLTAWSSAIDGPPTGQITIQAGSTTICTITLDNGEGTCTLTASQLPPGSYQLTATYDGDIDFAQSTSAPQALTITP